MILAPEPAATPIPALRIALGLLVLRLGIGLSFILLFILKQSDAPRIFALHPGRVLPLLFLSLAALLVVVGFVTELAGSVSALAWAWAMYSGLHAGLQWYGLPVRAALYVILFTALSITGPGIFSLDSALRQRR